MSRILHISDSHFGTEHAAVVEALRDLALSLQPELVVFTGDITQRARRSQFDAANQFIHQLPAPVIAVPGNHDIPLFNLWARWRRPYEEYQRVFKGFSPVWQSANLSVIGLNTSRPGRHKNGVIAGEQIRHVAALLRASSPSQLRVVIQHHPVSAVEDSDFKNLAKGREQAVPAWVDAGMDLLLAGHIHLPYVKLLSGFSGRQAWTVQAGTALSRRVRGGIPNSVNVLEHHWDGEAHHCQCQRWDYQQSNAQFVEVSHQELAIQR